MPHRGGACMSHIWEPVLRALAFWPGSRSDVQSPRAAIWRGSTGQCGKAACTVRKDRHSL